MQRKRVENKTHHLLGGENVRKRVKEGTHHFLGKGLMNVFDKEEQGIIRIHKDLYHQNKDRFLTLTSKAYKKIKEG